MSTTLSSATAAAKTAQADLIAPVAANPASALAAGGRGAATVTNAKPSNNSAGTAASTGNDKAQGGQSPAAAQPAARDNNTAPSAPVAQQAANTANVANVAAAAAPLFAQLLNVAGVTTAVNDDSTDTDTGDGKQTGSDDAIVADSAATGSVLPAMITSMLNVAPPAQPAQTAADAETVRVDAVSAAANLNASATRLNLAAASVAVMPPATEAVAAPVTPAPATVAANSAALANAATRELDNEQAPPSPAPALAAGITTAVLTSAGVRLPVSEQQPKTAAPAQPAIAAKPTAQSDANLPSASPAPAPANYAAAPSSAPRTTDSATPAPAPAPAAVSVAAASTTVATDDGNNKLPGATATVSHLNVVQTATPATGQASATVKLAGTPEQWQQPLREALGDRLQVQLQRNNDHAVIRLEPPNMGAIEISIRHSAGTLQVNLSASNSEVVRQLNTISDGVRQDLSNRQFAEVSVSVSSARAQAQAQADQGQGRNGQQRGQDDARTPGRALSDDDSTATFAMTGE
ncbi:flagellar hook-length control protein FliK [Duganella sp. FT94W]|uniref:Flagellar hook-length control protein FliK n=1 Tax=Duganella lactea TaxID=2692173 RepID=A0ABW9V4V7_9BURK|nr:flagellar hook-length control protein FliK [Duganella lactea]MYM34729.1 flagellar hook-length control protein FliK [Duganella lactea]